MTTSFVCSHSKNDDRPTEVVSFYRNARGNGASRHLDQATAAREEAEERLRGIHAAPRSAQLPEIVRRNQEATRAHADLAAATSAVNHHQLECRTCGFTERITGADVERLLAWAQGENLTRIPLRQARRILAMI